MDVMYKIVYLLITIFLINCFAIEPPSLNAQGTLMCGEKPLNGAKIQLLFSNKTGNSYELGETKSIQNGTYAITASIDPKALKIQMKIFHNCLDKLMPCKRTANINIPRTFITGAGEKPKWFNTYTMNMELIPSGEVMVCYSDLA